MSRPDPKRVLRRLLTFGLLVLLGSPAAIFGESPGAQRTPSPESPSEGSRGFQGQTDLGGLILDARITPLAETGGTETGGAETDGSELTEGETVRFSFSLRDAVTGKALTGIFPAAWMDLSPPNQTAEQCTRRIEMLLAGGLLSRAELDLNVYYVVALNDTPTLTVVDPLFGFGGSKLLALVELRGPGEDWARSFDQRRLFVTVPEADGVAVVDTAAWQVETYVKTGPDPRRIRLAPDGRSLWVSFEGNDTAGRSGVSVLHPDRLAEAARVYTGPGPHDIEISDDGRFVFVTNGGAEAGTASLTVIDGRSFEVLAELDTGSGVVDATWSKAAGALFVAHADGTVALVQNHGVEKYSIAARIRTEPGLSTIHASPEGRHVLALDREDGLLHVIDPAARRLVQTGPMAERPDQIVFSDTLAYVRHAGSDQVLMIPLAEIGEPGNPIPAIDFPGGHGRPERARAPASAPAMVPSPGANGVLLANPVDEAVYFYAEGMAAPMGSFDNYGHQPRAVTVIDNSLRQHRPGVYETTARLRRPGRYQLAFFLDAPRTARCFEVTVAADPQKDARRRYGPLRLRPTVPDGRFFGYSGDTVSVELDALDPVSGEPRLDLQDLEILAFLSPGSWQTRGLAQEIAPGRYRFEFEAPRSGIYYLHATSESAQLRFGDSGPVAYVSIRERVSQDAEPTADPTVDPAVDTSRNGI